MNATEAQAGCLARGIRAPECAEMIAAQSVDGVYCDGTILYDGTIDPATGKARGKRCVPRAVVDAVEAARKASPLPTPVKVSATGTGEIPTLAWVVVGVVAVGIFVAVVR